jgi:uncharacterized protein (DUF58 family)
MEHTPSELLSPSFLRKLEAVALWAGKAGHGQARGERSSRQAGGGIAFAGHRAYAPGDDVRFIDFRLLARSERMYLKQFEEERELSIELLVDCSASMGDKLALAKQLAGALGFLALVHLDRVAIQPFAAEPLPRLDALRGKQRALSMLRFLAALEARGGTDLPRAARHVIARSRRGSLAFVVGDGFDPEGLLRGVDMLRHAHLQPVVLLIVDARERAPTWRGELTLLDRESARELTLYVDTEASTRYRVASLAAHAALVASVRGRSVPVFTIDLALPVERAVLHLLRQGGMVG